MSAKRWFKFFTPKMRSQDKTAASHKQDELKQVVSRLPTLLELPGSRFKLAYFAEGGICEVLTGVEIEGNRKIAIKLLKPEWKDHQGVRRQFSTESQVVRSLNHPLLPKYFSRGILQGRAYFSYHFIEGIPLIKLSQRQDLFPPSMVRKNSINIIQQILDQLDHLNTKLNPVAHGDISSENIIFDDDLNAHLVDFGCAHFLKLASKESYQWIAKPSFVTPEQARGESWGHASDLYQTGILFFELLTARRWNQGKTSREKILFAATGDRPNTHLIEELAGNEVKKLIDALLEPDPKNRIQTAAEAKKLLGKLK